MPSKLGACAPSWRRTSGSSTEDSQRGAFRGAARRGPVQARSSSVFSPTKT
ncbi:MAG TPA: hypothetical protein VII13_12045 [Vicinamibacteria bacterium]